MTQHYLPALTGFRAVAALLVFLFHYRPTFAWLPEPLARVWQAVTSELHLGVSLFFTLSGFLLCRGYYAQPGSKVGQYLLRRFARLYPLLFLLTTVTYLVDRSLLALPAAEWWQRYLLNVTLLKSFSAAWYLTDIDQAWSLTVEGCFYLLLPGFFWLAHRTSPRVWVAGVLGLLVLGLVLSQLLRPFGWLETTEFMLFTTIFGRSAEFMIGAGFARLSGGFLPRATRWGLVASVAILGLQAGIAQQQGLTSSVVSWPGLALNNWGLPWATGLLLYGLATQRTWLSEWLSSRPMQVLGRSSYAFYLVHMGLFADFLQGRLHKHLPQLPPLVSLLVALIMLAILLHYLIERPLHRLLVSRQPPVA